ncbi:MAG: hypothetical protein HC883_00775 [Bdellovibrionaceae bacterium]|nr:hypothetical protein [Pseudobdellovibrionaceae bacterium]
MDVSRRDFFKSIIPKAEQNKSVAYDRDVITLGHLTLFPVRSSTKVKLMGAEFLVESLPEGIRLRSLITNRNLKLSLNSGGLIQAHINEFWQPTAVLSIFTGEIYNI